MQSIDLLSVLDETRKKIAKFKGRSIGEENTKASLIEPVLEALGWDIRDPDEVHREFRANRKDSPVDYALKLLRKPRLFLEAKGLGQDLSDRKWIAQVLGYATVAGVEWCLLTDGNHYRFFNATAAVDAEEKLFREIKISNSQPEEAARILSLISRANLEENLLDVLWENYFSDRRVKVALQEMLGAPKSGLLRLLKKRLPALRPKQISDSLARLDIKISMMELDLPKPVVVCSRGGQDKKRKREQIPAHPRDQQQQLEKADAPLKALFSELRKFVLGLGDDVTEKVLKYYIGYQRKGNFLCCQIQPASKRIRAWLALSPDSIKTAQGFVRDVRNIGHHGIGDTEITVTNQEDLEEAKPLIVRSYRESK